MATFYIQLENKLLQISGDLTAENISKALGYVPVSPNVTNELSQRVDNITFDSLKDNPFLQDGSGELNIVDESGNIIAKIDADGIHSVDFIAGNHKLTDKIDSSALNGYAKESWVTAEITKAATEGKVDLTGYATEEWVENKNYLTEHQDISHLATKDEVSNIDFYNIKDNPIVNNGDGKLLFVDENGYIGLQLEEDGLYVKDVIADGHTLSQKADKSELSNYATKDEVSDLVDMSVVTELQGKVETLVGEDADKSVRDIAVDVLTETLVSETATEAYDTLAEMSAWIKSHPEDAAAMNTAIQKNATDITNLDAAYKAADTKVLTDAQEYTDNINFYTIKDNPIVDGEAGSITFVDETGYIGLKVTEDGIVAKDVVTPEHTLSSKADKSFVEDNYYNKSTVDKKITEAVTNGTVDLDGFATEQWVNEQGFLKEHQDISHLAEKSELPTKTSDLTNDSGFITIDDVPVQEIPEEYVTDEELSQKGFLVGEETSEELDDVETNTYVKYVAQTLTEEQKAQVRNNIGVMGSDSNTFVSYTQQSLTEEQQKQARLNLGISEVSSINYDLNVKAINHRGYSSEAPENTIPAYILSKQKGFTYVEADVAFTKDNVSVLLHDLTIDRTSNGSGKIKDLTYEQVLQYDFGSWKSQAYKGVKIASFKEFIVLCKRLGLHPYIELKSSDNYTQEQITQIVKEVNACGMNGKVTYISFYAKYLRYVKDVDQISRLGFVVTSISSGTIDAAIELKTGKNEVFIDASLKNLTDDGVQLCIENGIPLEVWTVNKEADIINMPSYICGVTSDELIAGKVLYNQGLNYVPPISNYVPTESITLSQSSLSFNNRESQTIEAILEPSNASSKVEWSTSDSNIAIVENGVVTPTDDGTCTITAISDEKSASCEVNVDFIKYSITSQLLGCSLNNSLDKVVIGDSYTTEITPDNGYSLKNGEVSVMMGGVDITSSSYNNGVITIDNVSGDISITVTCMEVPVYNITRNLIGCTSNKDITSIGEGNPYSETFTPIDGFKLNDATVNITMGGVDITSLYINNTLSISEVMGDIVINITAVEVPVYSITRNLTNCTSDKDVTAIREGETYIETLTANDGYTLSNATVNITMGGVDITSSSYNNGVITIGNVNGDIIINASGAEFDGLLVDLDLVNVGEDGVVRNLGAGGSTYNTVVSKPKANDSFSASSSGLTLGNHAYVNVPYEFTSADSFTIICKARIKTDSSNAYQRLFRTKNDAPSWFIKGTTTPTIKLAGSVGSIEILNDLAAKVSANNAIYIGSMDRSQMNEITITCDGSIIKCYYNGVLMATQPSTSMNASTAIGIGDNDTSKSYYATEIEIERFAIYNRCLTMES